MSAEVKTYHIKVGEQFLGQHIDDSREPTPFVVVKFSTEVVLRGKGVGDVIVDVERFLREGISSKGRLRFQPLT